MLAFTGQADRTVVDSEDLYLVGVDGSGLRLLVTGGSAPAWSTRGEIAFARNDQIFRLDPDTGTETRVAEGDNPDFSPSGLSIVYSLPRPETPLKGDESVYRVRATGSPQKRLLARHATRPVFSPDAKRIAFIRLSTQDGQRSLRTASARNGTRQRVVRRGLERPIGSQFLDWNDVAWRPLP